MGSAGPRLRLPHGVVWSPRYDLVFARTGLGEDGVEIGRHAYHLEFVALLEQAPRTLPRQILILSNQHPQA